VADQASIVNVLIVEDNPGDIFLMKQGIEQQSKVAVKIEVSTDGEAAIAALAGQGQQPDLVILDLNLPKRDGFDVLKSLRGQGRSVPLLVLTSSKSQRDIRTAHELGASAFVTKPDDFDDYMRMMRDICSSWIEPIQRVKAEA
jgi:CheY-like chemotaxis protein